MFSLHDIFRIVSLGACPASNDKSPPRPGAGLASAAMTARDSTQAFDPDHDDPYLADARRARRLAAGARLLSSVDGNPAAVLNMMSMHTRDAA